LVEDVRTIPAGLEPAAVAVGLYGRTSGGRLPAWDDQGTPLPDGALTHPLAASSAGD
jgi:hypothetical protein